MITCSSYLDFVLSLDGLVAHYRLNDWHGPAVLDSSRNRLHGIADSSIVFNDPELSRTGRTTSTSFPATSAASKILLPPSDTLWTGWDQFTINMWLKVRGFTGEWGRLVNICHASNHNVFRTYVGNAPNNNNIYHDISTSNGWVGLHEDFVPHLSEGAVVMASYIYIDPVLYLYINGTRYSVWDTPGGVTAIASGAPTNIVSPAIGGGYENFSRYNGWLQDVSIFRRALKPRDIFELYRLGTTLELERPLRSFAAVNPSIPYGLLAGRAV